MHSVSQFLGIPSGPLLCCILSGTVFGPGAPESWQARHRDGVQPAPADAKLAGSPHRLSPASPKRAGEQAIKWRRKGGWQTKWKYWRDSGHVPVFARLYLYVGKLEILGAYTTSIEQWQPNMHHTQKFDKCCRISRHSPRTTWCTRNTSTVSSGTLSNEV